MITTRFHHLVFLLLSTLLWFNSLAQQFSTAEISTIKPVRVIIENYTCVNLSGEVIDDALANIFDINNPYTYLQIVNDAAGKSYHILLQTNFMGKILFLAYSNNLSAVFNKKEKPKFLLLHCLKEINNHLSSVQVMDEAVKCIVERLNYCSED